MFRKFHWVGFLKCFYYVTNCLVEKECTFLKFLSFTFMKIEENYLLFLIHLNSADLRGNKTVLQKMSMTAMERYDKKHQPKKDNACLKLRCYARESLFFFFLQKAFHRSILSWVPVLPDRSRKIVTNEIFQELCNFTSILLV